MLETSREPRRMISIERFGRDHWSLLAYVETIVVDGPDDVGRIDKRRLRANPAHHPMHHVNGKGWDVRWGTRLRGFSPEEAGSHARFLSEHDDWDCLDDLEAAGLVDIVSCADGYVRLTPAGQTLAGALRAHKAAGGTFASFAFEGALARAAE